MKSKLNGLTMLEEQDFLRLRKEIIMLAIAIILILGALLINTFIGDALIGFNYARNIAKGDFFSFNPGEFSSGTSSPIWTSMLSIAFFFEDSILIAKLIGLASMIIAFYLVLYLIDTVNINGAYNSISAYSVVYLVGVYPILVYDTGLIVSFIAIMFIHTSKVLNKISSRKDLSKKDYIILAVIWSSMPLVRPDAIYIVGIHFILVLSSFYQARRPIKGVIIIFIFSSIPSLIWFGYSYFATGTLSTSSYSRTFSLKENQLDILKSSIIQFSSSPGIFILIFSIFTLLSSFYYRKDDNISKVAYLSIATVSYYFFVFMILLPANYDFVRYVAPVIPSLALFTSMTLDKIDYFLSKRNECAKAFRAVVILSIVVGPTAILLQTGYQYSIEGWTFDKLMEKKIINQVNIIAEPNSTLLTYEIQSRYYLRPDVRILSLDGATDGKMAPYLENSDLYSFLIKYRPKYWIANDAIYYRPYLNRSILRQVVDKTGDKTGESIKIKCIRFTNIFTRNEPPVPHFAGYKQLYQLEYSISSECR